MTIKSSISLTNQQDAFARALVKEGRYPSVSAVVQQGLDLLRHKTQVENAEIAALRMLIDQRRAGAFVSTAEMGSEVAGLVARKRREHGLEN